MKNKCPLCNHVLYKKNEGLVCKNHKCKLYFKLGIGWVFLDGNKGNNLNYFKDKYAFDILAFENKKRWLLKKAKIFHERERKCEICGTEISIEVHHIISRTKQPCLTFDNENLIVLCENCHKRIHSEDKHRYG